MNWAVLYEVAFDLISKNNLEMTEQEMRDAAIEYADKKVADDSLYRQRMSYEMLCAEEDELGIYE